MFVTTYRTRAAFTLLELIIVVVIIGIIAAIAVPRMSRGSSGAADKALASSLSIFRSAIDRYTAEHIGDFPSGAAVSDQLTKYTDIGGHVADAKDATHIYGPYLFRAPPLPVGARKSCTGIAVIDGPGVGWIYTSAGGTIRANCAAGECDIGGTEYRNY